MKSLKGLYRRNREASLWPHPLDLCHILRYLSPRGSTAVKTKHASHFSFRYYTRTTAIKVKFSNEPIAGTWDNFQTLSSLTSLFFTASSRGVASLEFLVLLLDSCHKRQKPQAPTPQAPIRNRQTRKVANAKGLNRNTNLT